MYNKKILIVSMGGIGNLILFTPILKILSEQYPKSKVSFLLRKNGSKEIIEHYPQRGDVLETDISRFDIVSIIRFVRKLKPDIVIPTTGTNSLKVGILGFMSRAKLRIGENVGFGSLFFNKKVPYDFYAHDVLSNIKLIKSILPVHNIPNPIIWTSESDIKKAKEFFEDIKDNKKIVGIHPGSGNNMKYKRWPIENFLEVSKLLIKNENCKIMVFGGKDEIEAGEYLKNILGNDVINVAGKFSLQESYELMKFCKLFVSNDSGPMHMAATAGCRVVAIFGPTQDSKTRPWGDKHLIITDNIECRPCYKYKPVVCKHLSCLTNITVDKVYSQIKKLLSQTN